MNIVAIIQARMGSQRLRGKSLADIAGQPLLGHVIDRVRASSHINEVVLATTEESVDDVLVNYAKSKKTVCFRGSSNDVLDRFFQAGSLAKADVVVRITADDPFKDPAIIDLMIAGLLRDPAIDYASNTLKPTYPEGLDVEVFRFHALAKAWHDAKLPSEREHVTPYIWKNPHIFKLCSLEHPTDLSKLRWTLDYEEDLLFARAVYASLYRGQIFGMKEILALLNARPQLADINQGFQRNIGYLNSLTKE